MKRMITTLIMLISIFSPKLFASNNSNYEIESMITDFNGIVTNGKNVLCYGNYGIITYSTNKGKDWKQLNIGDKYEIKKILYQNNVFYGVTNFGLIKSKDGGFKWEKKDIENIIGINSFTIANDKIYLQSKENIQVYDTNFALLDDNFLKLDSEFLINNIASDNSNLYLENNSIFLRVNLSNNHIDTILNILTIHKSCQKVSKLKIEKDNLYALINIKFNENWIIKSVDKGNTWTFYSKDSTTKKSCYNIVNDSVVVVSRRISKTSELFNLTYTRLYDNSIYKRSDSSNTRYIQSIPDSSIIDFVKIEDSYIVVGRNKMIIVSNDNGNSWEFKSYIDAKISTSSGGNNIGYTPFVPFITNKNTMYLPQNELIYKTTNSGITWLPQNYSDIYEKYGLSSIVNYYFDSLGQGVVLFSSRNNNDYTTITTSDYGDNYQVVKSTYNQFIPRVNTDGTYINLKKGLNSGNNIVLTRTFVENHSIRSVINVVDKYFNLINTIYLDSIAIKSIEKDENENLYCFGIYQSNFIPNDITFGDYEINKFVMLKSLDNGLTWKMVNDEISDLPRKSGNLIYDYKIVYVKDNKVVLFPSRSYGYYYVYNLNDNKLTKFESIGNFNFENREQLFEYNNKNFIIGAGDYLYYNFDLANNSSQLDSISCKVLFNNWEKINYSKYKFGNDIILTTWSDKKDVYFVMGKSIYDPNSFGTFTHKFNLAKFRDKTLTSVEESEIEEEPQTITSITQSTHIELYDILGRSIATFPSYEKLKAEIENYPPPHLIKWRDEKGIYHFEKMK